MDLAQARTFLAIVDRGNFSTAATRLHVTQSTVSARIKALEETLGKTLFHRNKHGCELTSAGHQFHRYARSIVRGWEDAKLQVAIPVGYSETLVVGGQYSLWADLLLDWVTDFRNQQPGIAIRGEIGMPDELMRELREGILDLAVLYDPVHSPGTRLEELFDDQLILVTTSPGQPMADGYVFIDWGEDFRAAHAAWFPELHNPGLMLDIGVVALNMILSQGGTAYLPERVVLPHLSNGTLSRVAEAPTFRYPAYVVYAHQAQDAAAIQSALDHLRRIASRSRQLTSRP